jgi:hypothetical protein
MRTMIACIALAGLLGSANAASPREAASGVSLGDEPSRSETLWIFDADFEDLEGDNAGWTSRDMSGEPGGPNYWHRDTIRNDYPTLNALGTTWWCGRYDTAGCWRQPRGYGNDWTMSLWRRFPEIAANTTPGDLVQLTFNQRYALQGFYDYAYLDVSDDDGSTWARVAHYTNPGGMGKPGPSQGWYQNDVKVIDLSAYAGQPVSLRFQVKSNYRYSSQDQYQNAPLYSYRDGAWMIDNLRLKKNGTQFWYDDCESFGDNGWVADTEPHNQAGVAFRRTLESVVDPPGWMMSAYAESTGLMTDDEVAWLTSPPIKISALGAEGLVVVECSGWIDLPGADTTGTHCRDRVTMSLHRADGDDCLWNNWELPTTTQACSAGPAYVTMSKTVLVDDGADWLGVRLSLEDTRNYVAAGHGRGFMLDRMMVGVLPMAGVPDDDPAAGLGVVQPNPSAGETSIAYTASNLGGVALRIYDLTGRVVRTLVDGPVEPGEHEAMWDGLTDTGARAASGVYFVKLFGSDALASEAKLVLLK